MVGSNVQNIIPTRGVCFENENNIKANGCFYDCNTHIILRYYYYSFTPKDRMEFIWMHLGELHNYYYISIYYLYRYSLHVQIEFISQNRVYIDNNAYYIMLKLINDTLKRKQSKFEHILIRLKKKN